MPVAVFDGALPYFNSALLATKVAVKATSGDLYGYHIQNPNTSDAWVQFFDLASGSVTVGSTTPTLSLWVPAGGALDAVFAKPVNFATAVVVASTTTATGSTAPSTGLVVNLLYS